MTADLTPIDLLIAEAIERAKAAPHGCDIAVDPRIVVELARRAGALKSNINSDEDPNDR